MYLPEPSHNLSMISNCCKNICVNRLNSLWLIQVPAYADPAVSVIFCRSFKYFELEEEQGFEYIKIKPAYLFFLGS